MVSFLWVKVIDTTFSRSVVGKKIVSFQALNSCLWRAEDRNISAKISGFSAKSKEIDAENLGF